MGATRTLIFAAQKPALETAVKYAESVLIGDIIAGKLVKKACERFLNDLDTGEARGIYFRPELADRAVKFFGCLHHSKGEWGKTGGLDPHPALPFILEPWQIFILVNLFGFVNANGMRRFREAHIEIARKNGKSTFVAGIGLYMLSADGEPGAEVYSAATTKKQAKIVFDEADRMVTASKTLKARIQQQSAAEKYRWNMCILASGSKFEPLTADPTTHDGLNIHCALIDELHEHPTRALYDVLNTATSSRRQALILSVTTAGFNRQGICWKQRSHGERVLEGISKDDTFFAFIACLDADDKWDDERNWGKANPNLGVSCKLDDLRRKAAKAKDDPSALNDFLRKHLNAWTSSDVRWMPPEKWAMCCVSGEHADPKRLRLAALESLLGRKAVAGLDVASTDDIAAYVLLFPPAPARKVKAIVDGKEKILDLPADTLYSVLPWFWIPGDNVEERVRKHRVEYDVWIREGFLIPTDGDVIDQDFIQKEILSLRSKYQIDETAYDRWNNTQLCVNLEKAGLKVIQTAQTTQVLSEPMKLVMTLTLQKKIEHFNNPMLKWMMNNVSAFTDPNGFIKPNKAKSTEKIDGVTGLINAMSRLVANPQGTGVNPYATRGISFI